MSPVSKVLSAKLVCIVQSHSLKNPKVSRYSQCERVARTLSKPHNITSFSVEECALSDIMTSLSRRVCILMVVCSLLAEGLLVEAKGGRGGGRGRSRGGYGYGGGGYSDGGDGGDFPYWTIVPIIIGACVALACCCTLCEVLNEDENER